ncbi:phospholipid/cholesterol/gamma-HCH transport system permease protein [Prosthecobacter debontii]|uniref:Phospholipid/cholesterol/gamma-HCH transport system permease protein n=1 Tax=Prosthecobacter debontii TaxID=48467 RepID=A0A1T4WFV6_9BACT|nr:ABC transporter permease [Prosthecobacter debontii]SKA75858.1 phospholipid/cholesterol/gamma-HCH transport system permease protein [Prosthecobacter debontii]
MGALYGFLAIPGRSLLNFLGYLGQLGALLGELWQSVTKGTLRLRLMAEQIVTIGYGSQAVVLVTGAFTGAVFTAQSYFKFKDFGIESTVGGIVSVSLCRELGPVLAGLMVTGRVGASMAAEIGTMKVSEQVDALRVMGAHPVDYLVLPRFLAMMISMPLLIAECIVFGLAASVIVGTGVFEIPFAWFWEHVRDHTNLEDLSFGMIKGFVFGILIVLISCHQGLIASNGAVGVGLGTIRAVVFSSLALLVANFFLTMLLNYFFPLGTAL